MPTKGTITFRGDSGAPENHYSKGTIHGITDDAALATLLTTLGSHTLCNVAKRAFSSNTAGVDAAPGADANVDRKAIYYFRDPTTLNVHSFTIPAPVDADCVDTSEGERVTAAALASVVGAINTATGKSYSALYGVVIQGR
jgi:hypothetical protein